MIRFLEALSRGIQYLAKALSGFVGLDWVLARIRDAAEGRLGQGAKAAYWFLAGAKTWSGFGLAIAAGAFEAIGEHQWAVWVGAAAGVLISAGLVDKAWRADIPAVIAQSGLYRFLAGNSAGLSALLATAFAGLEHMAATDPHYAVAAKVVLALAALGVQLGLVDAAWRSKPPVVPLDALGK